jgi:hypothetical protein
MSHLSPERFAALVDDTLTPIESAHVTTCAACTAEMAAQRKLARLAAAASSDYGPPSSDFNALVPRLRAEGIVDGADRRATYVRWAVRIAASVGFVAAGAAVGRLTAGAPVLALGSTGATGAVSAVAGKSTGFTSQEDAIQVMMASQQAYQNAAAFLAAQDTSQHFTGLNTDAYRTRLAALDEMTSASRTGLYRAPQDPLLNQYYLAFQAAREQTLQQLQVSLPSKRQLGRY